MKIGIGLCPICRHKLKHTVWYGEAWIEEEYNSCSNCGYSEEFMYGNYAVYVQGKEFFYTYGTPTCDPVFRHIQKAIFAARRNWKKFKRTYK